MNFMFLFLKLYFMSSSYEIMPVKSMFSDIKDLDNQFDHQDSLTMASIYRGNSGKYYLIPAVGSLGIKSDKGTIDSILKSGNIPIVDDNPFALEKERLSAINHHISYFESELFKSIQININTDSAFESLDFKEINKKINSLSSEEAYKTYFIPLGIVMGENLRKRIGGEWMIEKRYGYNPYFQPYIRTMNGRNILPWYRLADMLLKRKFDMKTYIEDLSKERRHL